MCGTMNEWMIGRMDMSIDGRKEEQVEGWMEW